MLTAQVVVTPSTNRFGIQNGLDFYVNYILALLANNFTTITSKSKGTLNSLPAYRIEYEGLDNPLNYTGTAEKIPFHYIMYLTVRGQTMYGLIFGTIDNNPQANFIPIVNKLVGSFQFN